MARVSVIATRRLHLIDIENLVGGSHADRADVEMAFSRYLDAARPRPGDHMIVVTGRRLAPATWFAAPRGARLLLGSGIDGADRVLGTAVTEEQMVDRYSSVVIGSGDAYFAPLAQRIVARGGRVEVIARPSSIAGKLSAAASKVCYLEPPFRLTA